MKCNSLAMALQLLIGNTVKPATQKLTKVLMTNGNLMKVESIAECSPGAFCNTSDLH